MPTLTWHGGRSTVSASPPPVPSGVSGPWPGWHSGWYRSSRPERRQTGGKTPRQEAVGTRRRSAPGPGKDGGAHSRREGAPQERPGRGQPAGRSRAAPRPPHRGAGARFSAAGESGRQTARFAGSPLASSRPGARAGHGRKVADAPKAAALPAFTENENRACEPQAAGMCAGGALGCVALGPPGLPSLALRDLALLLPFSPGRRGQARLCSPGISGGEGRRLLGSPRPSARPAGAWRRRGKSGGAAGGPRGGLAGRRGGAPAREGGAPARAGARGAPLCMVAGL